MKGIPSTTATFAPHVSGYTGCVAPETPTLEAIRLMRERGLSALPVVWNRQLVGIISERDFLPIAAHVLATASG